MTGLGERLARIQVHVRVPGTDLEAVLRNRSDITLTFGADDYAALDDRTLASHLTALARLLFAGYVRQYREAVEDSAIVLDSVLQNDRDREFIAARDELEVTGSSTDGKVTITATGMRNVRVRLASGTTRALSERQFGGAMREAVASVIENNTEGIDELKRRIYT